MNLLKSFGNFRSYTSIMLKFERIKYLCCICFIHCIHKWWLDLSLRLWSPSSFNLSQNEILWQPKICLKDTLYKFKLSVSQDTDGGLISNRTRVCCVLLFCIMYYTILKVWEILGCDPKACCREEGPHRSWRKGGFPSLYGCMLWEVRLWSIPSLSHGCCFRLSGGVSYCHRVEGCSWLDDGDVRREPFLKSLSCSKMRCSLLVGWC